MRLMKKHFTSLLLCLTFTVGCNIANALPVTQDQCNGNNPPPWCPVIPIDGGLSYILIAGVALGGRKLYRLNKES